MTEQSVIIYRGINVSPKKIDKDAKKDEILLAAMRIIARIGYRDVKMADIAEAAGVGKGTIYEYFASKEELFAATFEKFRKDVEAVHYRKMKPHADAADTLKNLIDSWIEVMNLPSADYMELLTDFWTESIGTRRKGSTELLGMAQVYSGYREQVVSIIEKGIRSGRFKPVDSLCAAAVLLGAIDGLILQWMLDKKAVDIEQSISVLYEIFMRGIAR